MIGVQLVLSDLPSNLTVEYDTTEKVLMVWGRKDLVLDVGEATVIINKKNKTSPTQKWTISTTGLHFLIVIHEPTMLSGVMQERLTSVPTNQQFHGRYHP